MEISSKEIVYMTIFLALVLFGVFFIVKFVPEIGAKVKDFIKDTEPLTPQEVERAENRFVEYIENDFLDVYKSCRNSEKSSCWCTKEEFEIPSKFFVEIFQDGNKVGFKLLNSDKISFTKSDYFVSEVNSCLFNKKTKKFDNLNDKITIEKSSTPIIRFQDKDGKEQVERVDLSLLFYKYKEGNICIIDEESSIGLKSSQC